jgi:hypothetical protein
LRKLVEDQEKESAKPVADCTRTTARQEDLAASAEVVLLQLPGNVPVHGLMVTTVQR